MWRYESNARPYVTDLEGEILLRVVLALVVIAMELLVQPHIQYITQDALLTDFKRPRRQSLVPVWALVCLIIFVPAILLALPWLLTKNYIDTTQAILAWTLALAINAIITETLKLSVGRPRPDFFYRCFPDGVMTYARELPCTGHWRDVIEGRKSFPSGHSSFSFASLGFLSLWICGKWRADDARGRAAKAICCALPLAVATAIAVSRVCDNRHHWGDVLCGSAIGIVTSYFCYTYYFNPLDSNLAGSPYILTDLIDSTSSTTHCSRYLNIADRSTIMEFSDKDISCNVISKLNE